VRGFLKDVVPLAEWRQREPGSAADG
jgi:hypothetical protein